MVIGLKETFDQNKDSGVSFVSAVDVSPPPNYEELAKLDGYPRVGDVVAYKVLLRLHDPFDILDKCISISDIRVCLIDGDAGDADSCWR